MIDTLTRRIQVTCRDELSLFRRQMYSLAWQEIREGCLEGAATAMAPKPSCLTNGVSIDVVCFAHKAALEHASFVISVAMHVHPDSRAGQVFWEEADAWAHAVAGDDGFIVEPRGALETPNGRVFHYALSEKVREGQIIPLEAAGS